MKRYGLLACVLAIIPVAAYARQATTTQSATTTTATKSKPAAKGEGRTIELTGDEKMKYDKTELAARPGEKLHIVLKALGTLPKLAMAHNFVLLKPDASPLEINNAAMTARATDFIPESMKDKIIAFTPLAGGGETVEVTFTAPTKPGAYTYLCTFPGHYALGMKGTLTVK